MDTLQFIFSSAITLITFYQSRTGSPMAYIELLTNQIQIINNKNNCFISKNILSVFIQIHCTAEYSLACGMKNTLKSKKTKHNLSLKKNWNGISWKSLSQAISKSKARAIATTINNILIKTFYWISKCLNKLRDLIHLLFVSGQL